MNWMTILKGRIRMHEYNTVYDLLIDGEKRTVGEIARETGLGTSKVYHLMIKMLRKNHIFPGVKREELSNKYISAQSYLYWREVSR